MKVSIAQLADATFHRYCWWSNWIDVAVFDYAGQPYLIQMRISRTNSKQFKAVCITGAVFYKQARSADIGDLVQMGRE